MKQIVIKLSVDGTVEAETLGMRGVECQKYLNQITSLTGAVPVESQYKKIFYEDSNIENIANNNIVESADCRVRL